MYRIKNITTGELLQIVGTGELSFEHLSALRCFLNEAHEAGTAHTLRCHEGQPQEFAVVLESGSAVN